MIHGLLLILGGVIMLVLGIATLAHNSVKASGPPPVVGEVWAIDPEDPFGGSVRATVLEIRSGYVLCRTEAGIQHSYTVDRFMRLFSRAKK